jgi:hypothetical protein
VPGIESLDDANHDVVGVQLSDQVLERVPRRGVGAMHIVEHQYEETLSGDRPHVLGQLAEEPVLAAGVTLYGRCVVGAECRLEILQLRPSAPAGVRDDVRRSQKRLPNAIRLVVGMLGRRRHDEQSAA